MAGLETGALGHAPQQLEVLGTKQKLSFRLTVSSEEDNCLRRPVAETHHLLFRGLVQLREEMTCQDPHRDGLLPLVA